MEMILRSEPGSFRSDRTNVGYNAQQIEYEGMGLGYGHTQ